jgi:DNA polymerase-4
VAGKTITLKIKYSDFTQQNKTVLYFISDKGLILEIVKELLYQELKDSIRLLGSL